MSFSREPQIPIASESPNTSPGPRRIKKLLVANRGEIAVRIIGTAREMDLEVFALFTDGDENHAHNLAPDHVLKLPSPSTYTDIDFLINLSKEHRFDAIHPGYGFLSESADFARRMLTEAGVMVIGPGWEVLERTGDKLQSRLLAQECDVPVLPELGGTTKDASAVMDFAERVGYPVIVKATDGGGGRGIRIVRNKDELSEKMTSAIFESPSRSVYVEKAAVGGYRHVEVQVVGDYQGTVMHMWERECSIQRRFQKVVEFAPSSIKNRKLIGKVIEAAVRMAKKAKYVSLGTFEFLVHESKPEFWFLEINPRIQVEHTITEQLCFGVDLVKVQIEIARGIPLASLLAKFRPQDPCIPPPSCSIQMRICAEDVDRNWSLSVGKITGSFLPSGNLVRVDTHVMHPFTIVGTHFDSLLAKVIVTAPEWRDAVKKARRVLDDCRIEGVKTNIDALQAILASEEFKSQTCDTQWLENYDLHKKQTIRASQVWSAQRKIGSKAATAAEQERDSGAPSTFSLQVGDILRLVITPEGELPEISHRKVVRVDRNDPTTLSASIINAAPKADEVAKPFTINLTRTEIKASARHLKGDRQEPGHVIAPIPGRLIEILVEDGDIVAQGETIAVIQQMKMELQIEATRDGVVTWSFDGDENEEVEVGTLIAVISEPTTGSSKL